MSLSLTIVRVKPKVLQSTPFNSSPLSKIDPLYISRKETMDQDFDELLKGWFSSQDHSTLNAQTWYKQRENVWHDQSLIAVVLPKPEGFRFVHLLLFLQSLKLLIWDTSVSPFPIGLLLFIHKA